MLELLQVQDDSVPDLLGVSLLAINQPESLAHIPFRW
jgi:hypothetical protein